MNCPIKYVHALIIVQTNLIVDESDCLYTIEHKHAVTFVSCHLGDVVVLKDQIVSGPLDV